MKTSFLLASLLVLASTRLFAQACVIESNDDDVPIRLCQQNVTIPKSLFEGSFCRPQIPNRSFEVTMTERCPTGAYGICKDSQTEGVAYQQSIHYYSDPADAPVLSAYCTQISKGIWEEP
ncbi:MAG TPA: NADH:ubiquinone oxidoreductase [Pseudomonas xinjiangensis]|uniref:NADH:ubiquinone oxidoreductase n=2 Tax=root TaxID=1 RepID=A0A7V1BSH2_9GAMM|nr:NADH:ubiquinone oxidoreductase [Halopseudomonas xinjiangensis]HEC46961.1 NADH:ubiquinone oxidoreductase [Halopseudomonas xinjiangensis]